MDFTLNITHGGEIRILQITDMQTIDANQRRYPTRIEGWKLTEWVPEKNDENSYSYIRDLVKRSSPDLIIITGDITYGEFDDAGTSQLEFCEFMDSLEIPWAPVYGNHDNETKMGVEWQNEQYEKAKYSLFKKGDVFGNGNYSIAVKQNGKTVRKIAMMDSNGCAGIGISGGFRDDQLQWLKNTMSEEADVPGFVCFHIQTRDFADANIAAGYQADYDTAEKPNLFEIGKDVPSKNGDFGKKGERFGGDRPIHALCKECGIDGVFVGHCHANSTSVLYDGVRYTFGLKTGLYDYYLKDSIGGTLITLDDKRFSVKHLYCDAPEPRE